MSSSGGLPLIGTNLSLVGLSLIHVLGVLYGIEAVERARMVKIWSWPWWKLAATLWSLALITAAAVVAWQGALIWSWYGEKMPLEELFGKGIQTWGAYRSCTGAPIVLLDLFDRGWWATTNPPGFASAPWQRCFRFYETGGIVIYALISFCSIAFFLPVGGRRK